MREETFASAVDVGYGCGNPNINTSIISKALSRAKKCVELQGATLLAWLGDLAVTRVLFANHFWWKNRSTSHRCGHVLRP